MDRNKPKAAMLAESANIFLVYILLLVKLSLSFLKSRAFVT